MGPASDYQVVVLAGGKCKDLVPLISKDVPKALLPVANRPVLSYVLDLLEDSNLKDLILLVAGDDAAALISAWIAEAYQYRLQVEVVSVPEDADTADALRAASHRLLSDNVLIVSGDLVCDVPVGAVAAAHTRQKAVLTALICPRSTGDGSDPSSGGGKDKAKDYIGLDASHQRLLYIASGSQAGKELKVHRSLLREANQIKLHSDLIDAHLYAFNRVLLQEVLENRKEMHSVKLDIVPYVVRSQLKADGSTNLKCCAYQAGKGKYCARVNTIQSYGDINKDVAGDAIHLTGYSVSAHNNVIDTTVQLGAKTVVGAQCVIGENSLLGDKCSVKRSVVGRYCKIGSNVKIFNSVLMNHVTVEDGCLIQNSVICSNVQLQERASLKDCQVAAGYVVAVGLEHRAESLARKDKA